MNVGLIKRKNGKHTLTAFGKVIYDITLISIQNAINNYWKLKAIDSLEISDDLPAEEHKKLINNLIENHEIKTILVSASNVEGQTYSSIGQQKQIRQLKPELSVP
jgi:hypothetical protein